MADISIKGLNQFFGENQILHDITFDIFPGEKVAIVGPNGAGKTTLFRVITGELPYETGTISIAKNRTVGVIDQIPVYEPGDTVEQILRSAFHRIAEVRQRMTELEMQMEKNDDSQILKQYGALQAEFEAMGGYALDYEVDKVCNGLEIPKEMRAQPFDVLSGGEKTRVNLARIILEDTDILLLDEPTNHLDIESKEIFEEALREFPGTIVAVSHDRYFLNQIATKIYELGPEGITKYEGGFDYYEEKKAETSSGKQYLNQMRDLVGEAETERRQAFGDQAAADADGGDSSLPDQPLSSEEERALKKKRQAEERRKQRKIEQLESRIAELEEEIEEIQKKMCDPAILSNSKKLTELDRKQNEAQTELDQAYDEWATLEE